MIDNTGSIQLDYRDVLVSMLKKLNNDKVLERGTTLEANGKLDGKDVRVRYEVVSDTLPEDVPTGIAASANRRVDWLRLSLIQLALLVLALVPRGASATYFGTGGCFSGAAIGRAARVQLTAQRNEYDGSWCFHPYDSYTWYWDQGETRTQYEWNGQHNSLYVCYSNDDVSTTFSRVNMPCPQYASAGGWWRESDGNLGNMEWSLYAYRIGLKRQQDQSPEDLNGTSIYASGTFGEYGNITKATALPSGVSRVVYDGTELRVYDESLNAISRGALPQKRTVGDGDGDGDGEDDIFNRMIAAAKSLNETKGIELADRASWYQTDYQEDAGSQSWRFMCNGKAYKTICSKASLSAETWPSNRRFSAMHDLVLSRASGALNKGELRFSITPGALLYRGYTDSKSQPTQADLECCRDFISQKDDIGAREDCDCKAQSFDWTMNIARPWFSGGGK